MPTPIHYDPDEGPEPCAWLALGQPERIDSVRAWRRREGVEVPNERMFATMLATAETQVAHGDDLPVAATLKRLMAKGMSRREAIHAITTILAEATYDAFYGELPEGDPDEAYHRELRSLTPESWRTRFDETTRFPVF